MIFLWSTLTAEAAHGSLAPADADYYIFVSSPSNWGKYYFRDIHRVCIHRWENDSLNHPQFTLCMITYTGFQLDSPVSGPQDIDFITSTFGSGNVFIDYTGYGYNFSDYNKSGGSFETNLPIFATKEAAFNYLNTGDLTGNLNTPPVPEFDPVTDVHDFTKDVYDPDLSVPVLSNVSYTGFSIDNPDSKEWQVVVDGRVFGLKWNPSYTDPMLLTNTNYTVNHQVWNFADHPVNLSLSGRFDIYDNYGISTYDWFVEQVRQYANDVHPSDYPNYSFLKVGIKTGWNTFLDYIKDIGSDEAENPDGAGHRFEQNIYRSRMCQVTYYVRFVEYDVDGSPHYSRWMAYTLKPSQDVLVEGENFSRGNVEFGEVSDVDPVTGRPVVSDKESLKYNTSTGEYEYYDPLSNQGFQFEMNDVFGYLSGLKESVMGFADLIAYCFSFLPSWVSQFISYSLVVAISFSVIRLIRG